MNASSDIGDISGVGSQLTLKLNRLGIKSVEDLINYYPRRYDDFSNITKLNSLKPGVVTVKVKLTAISGRYVKRGLHISEALASDDTASVRLTWFNQPFRLTGLKKNVEYFVSGKYELKYRRFAIYNPTVETVSDFPINTARIVPRYPLSKGISSTDIRRTLAKVTDQISKTKETLPTEIIKKYKLISLSASLKAIHFPKSINELQSAKRRLGFEELFMMILASELNKKAYEHEHAQGISFDQKLASRFVQKLPFTLTNDQKIAVWQIYKDMAKTQPMNRLVEGDVGSGKTAVAAMAGLMVVNDGRQTVLMAPTELLARQHFKTVNLMFGSIGLEDKVALLIGGMSDKEKKGVKRTIKDKKTMFIIGTHALIQEEVEMPDLALVVIDEQHRFGVNQRQALKLKANVQPHMLSLSATPIPRSLALTLFGELDTSRLIDKPLDRLPVKTHLISESVLSRRITSIEKELSSGRQMFIVSPNIDADPKYSTSTLYDWAVKNFKGYQVGLIHGRLKADEKVSAMQNFIDKKTDILVATTVIEVGIDVPNATLMIIFEADRFGLAQLHQLRGRIGRGEHPGQVFLIYSDDSTPSDRLRALESSNDGFKLAELDLSIRGPGAIYGHLQHGRLDLRIAGLDDTKLIDEARQAAKSFALKSSNLLEYPKLSKEVNNLQKLTKLN